MKKLEHLNEIRKFTDNAPVLTGSRGIAARTNRVMPDETDYDYAVNYLYDEELSKAFREGWVEAIDKSYCDSNTSYVLEKTIAGDKVQISSRYNLETYLEAIRLTDTGYYWKYLWKQSPDCLPIDERKDYWERRYAEASSVDTDWIPF